jgi:hypothetical protein
MIYSSRSRTPSDIINYSIYGVVSRNFCSVNGIEWNYFAARPVAVVGGRETIDTSAIAHGNVRSFVRRSAFERPTKLSPKLS